MAPPNEELEQPARVCPVYGLSVLDSCLNPECTRDGPLDALILGPLNLWPNIVVVCGEDGCGVFWTLIGSPPKETTWLHVGE